MSYRSEREGFRRDEDPVYVEREGSNTFVAAMMFVLILFLLGVIIVFATNMWNLQSYMQNNLHNQPSQIILPQPQGPAGPAGPPGPGGSSSSSGSSTTTSPSLPSTGTSPFISPGGSSSTTNPSSPLSPSSPSGTDTSTSPDQPQ